MRKMILCAGVAALGLSLSYSAVAADFALTTEAVQPSATGAGITGVLGLPNIIDGYKHYVALPKLADNRKPVLVVFLGGSTSKPGDYTDISDFAAHRGYGVVNLRYPNSDVVGTVCNDDDACFRQFRGETIFGAGLAYAQGQPVYDSNQTSVDAANSIVNRLVALLDYLSHKDTPLPNDNSYWAQFLTPNGNSPYVTTHSGHVYPDWSKIVIAGHSQGGGHAAFIGTHLPTNTAVRRVVMLSAPNDNVGGSGATWILESASTPLSHFWGLRNDNEGNLGSIVSTNWASMGSSNIGFPNYGVGGGPNQSDVNVDTSIPTVDKHRLVMTKPNLLSTTNHNSTAANDVLHIYNNNREAAWTYMFTANGTD